MKKYIKFISVFGALSIIPLLFIGSSIIIINDMDSNLSIQLVRDLLEYKFYAWLLLGFGFISVLIICLLSIIANLNRLSLLITFKLGFWITTIVSSIFAISQTILLALTIYYLVAYFAGRIYPKLLILIVLGGIYAFYYLISNLFKKINKEQTIIGYSVDRSEQNKLWDFIIKISNNFNTKVPDNVVLGLGDNYYVLQSDIICLSGHLQGKTLFISLPCLYKFTEEEFESIIVHELSHFKGQDTLYTLHFYSTWRKIENSISDLDSINTNITLLPIRFLLVNFMNLFQLAEAKFSREREKIADLNGAKFTSNRSMAKALVKLSFFSNFWEFVERKTIETIRNEQYITNKNKLFNHLIANTTIENDKIKQLLETKIISHPVDSHPSLFERLFYLEMNLDDLLRELYISKDDISAASLINNIEKFEEDLSYTEQEKLRQYLYLIENLRNEKNNED